MSRQSFLTNCQMLSRKGDGKLFIQKNNGDVLARLNGYVILPVEEYARLKGVTLQRAVVRGNRTIRSTQ